MRKFFYPFVGIVFVVVGSLAAILFSKGYRPSLTHKTILPSGILVAQSYPDGAQVLVNGILKTATNNSLNLDPGQYNVEIKKDGFVTWKKSLLIQAEIVTRATATLFPSVPSLKAITTGGATLPVVSPDGSKVAYLLPNKSTTDLYTLDLNESPFGFINRDPKLVANIKFKISNMDWSPDSRQLLLSATASASLIDLSSSSLRDTVRNLTLSDWASESARREVQKQSNLPEKLKIILTSSTTNLIWSPKENKLLYTATASAVIPEKLIAPLPGSNTQPESRILSPGKIYVYDLEEDRNFEIDSTAVPSPTPKDTKIRSAQSTNADWQWFSDSSHLLKVENNKIIIKEYDNQNPTIVYAGPMAAAFAASYPSGKQILILSNLNPDNSPLPNLYAISLR